MADCDRPRHSRGLCNMHRRRLQKNGGVDLVKRIARGPERCQVDGCEAAGTIKRGMCSLHYQRWAKHGDPLVVHVREYVTGPDHPCWVGDAAAYRTIHNRLDRERGRAKTHPCTVCFEPADQWAYDHSDSAELIAVVHDGWEVPYSTDLARYLPLCFACHTRFDARRLPLVVN